MAIGISASTPAPVSGANTGGGSLVSASFSPPAGSLLAVCWANQLASTILTSCSGGGLSYSRLVSATIAGRSSVDVWLADVGSAPGSMSVTTNYASLGDNRSTELAVLVLTGTAPAATQVASAHTVASPGTGFTWATGLTLSAADVTSWIFAAAGDWDAAVTPAFPAGQTATFNVSQALTIAATGDTFWVQGNTAPGNSNLTMNSTTPSGATTTSTMVAFEILAASSVVDNTPKPALPGMFSPQLIDQAWF